MQKSSKRSAGLSAGGGVSFWGVSSGCVGVVGVGAPPFVSGGVASVGGAVSVVLGGGAGGSVSGIVSSGAVGGGSAEDSSSLPQPATAIVRQMSASSAPRRAVSAPRPAAAGRSEGSR